MPMSTTDPWNGPKQGFNLSSAAWRSLGARLVDDQHSHPDPERRQQAHALLDLLTPIMKSWPSEWCLEANKLAIEVPGRYGFTRD